MRLAILPLAPVLLFPLCGYGQQAPAFEVASVKPSSPAASAISCSGGPGASDPTLWKCSGVPIGLLIFQAYRFYAYQFRPNDPCCRDRFDIAAKLPEGATKDEFHRMLQTLLEVRFKLKLHSVKKEMPIYELRVAENGPRMTVSTVATSEPDNGWTPAAFTIGKDGYPVFPAGHGGLADANGHYHWVAFGLPMQEIVRTLSFYLGRPVVNATGLTSSYDLDLKWWIDLAWALERSGYADEAKDLPDLGRPGPTLIRAVEEQLGLKLISTKGVGEIIVIDHLEKSPTEN